MRVTTLSEAWKSGLAWLGTRRAELRLAVRVAVGGVASFAVAHYLGLPQGYWAVFTAVIVTQASIGGSLKATIDRFIGTLGGAIYGAVVAMVIPHQEPAGLGLALALALLPLGFVSAIDARFRVAPVTAVIVLLSPVGSQASVSVLSIDAGAGIAPVSSRRRRFRSCPRSHRAGAGQSSGRCRSAWCRRSPRWSP